MIEDQQARTKKTDGKFGNVGNRTRKMEMGHHRRSAKTDLKENTGSSKKKKSNMKKQKKGGFTSPPSLGLLGGGTYFGGAWVTEKMKG